MSPSIIRILRGPASQALLLVCVVFLGVLFAPFSAHAYSVLTHEAIIDSSWDKDIRPLLLQRFPKATPDELNTAHAFAYGGCAIQDLGYYPSGNKFFSDLVHYIRTGDFIESLIRQSTDLNEYAFAIGALAHYAADNNGHKLATNRAVPILYPRLRRKFGDVVTYADDPFAHLKTEFAFDVLQVARGQYAPNAYHDYIGFSVAKSLLKKAFDETYSLDIDKVFKDFDLTIGTYRHDVSALIPKATSLAWELKKDEIQKATPGMTRKKFLYNISRASYAKYWDGKYKEPGFGMKLLAFIIRWIPKVGPLRALSFRTPTPETERMFEASFNATLQNYESLLHQEKTLDSLQLVNDDFDTGTVTGPGEYQMADKTYAELLDRLAKQHFSNVSRDLQKVVLNYYKDPNAPFTTKKNRKKWATVLMEVSQLKAYTPQLDQPGSKVTTADLP